jgi:hydroxymethylpyrimidine/phosphomethylpyrimidine kinase
MNDDRSIPRILTISGSDSGGGAGIQADLKTIAILGGFGMSVVTALTAQNTVEVTGILEISPNFIARQFDAVASDIGVDAAKTGMLVTPRVVRLIAQKIIEYRIPDLVVDPVMISTSGTPLLSKEGQHSLLDALIPLATLVTPNLPEAEALAGLPVRTPDDMRRAAERIRAAGVRNVLVKGGHLEGQALDLLYDGDAFFEFPSERIATQHTHGTGCIYASAIATRLGQGHPIQEAVRGAKAFITAAIRGGLSLGRGHGPANPCAWIQVR